MKHTAIPARLWMLVAISLFFIIKANAQCCPGCEEKAATLLASFQPIVLLMPDAPANEADARAKLETFAGTHPTQHRDFMALIGEYREWTSDINTAGDRSFCFGMLTGNDAKTKKWVNEASSIDEPLTFRSSQFCRGFGFWLEGNIGGTNIGAKSERVYANLRALVSYTFAPTHPGLGADAEASDHCGGRFRLMLGLTEAYINNIGVLSGTGKIEYRLMDFSMKKTIQSFANVRLFGLYSVGINRDMQTIGGGIGLETGLFGLNITYEKHDAIANAGIMIGLQIPF